MTDADTTRRGHLQRRRRVEVVPSRRQVDADDGTDMIAACRAEALSKVYGRRDTAVFALRDVTLSIPSRAFSAIMGPSGSGKSTLLHCLAALDTPTSGRVFLDSTDLTSLTRRQQTQVRRDRIGFVFQAFNLVPTLDALENITLPQLLAGRRPDKDWLEYVVARIGLGDRLHHRPSQLSGGQQQRVALARALAGRPDVIFADEPTGNLDTTASRELLALLRSAVDDFHQTVVTVTHDPAFAGYADQVLFFTDGQVVDQVPQPDTRLVLEHLQYLDSGTLAQVGPRGGLHASTHTDGQHTMRNRRRRRADEIGPGRPMVGSDDEVEVARQERWLQRIREQFEAEQESLAFSDGGPGRSAEFGHAPPPDHTPMSNGRPATDHTPVRNGVPPRSDAPNGRATNGAGYDAFEHGTAHQAPDGPMADGEWLPPVRAWLMGASPDEVTADHPVSEQYDQPHSQHDAWSHAAATVSVDVPDNGVARPINGHDPEHLEIWPPTAPDADAEPLDIWAPADATPTDTTPTDATPADATPADTAWSTPADTTSPTTSQAEPPPPARGEPAAMSHDIPPAPAPAQPDTAVDETAGNADAWAAERADDTDDDPWRPEPRHQRQFNDTLTDPFEALASLQLQLDRLGGRRPPQRPRD